MKQLLPLWIVEHERWPLDAEELAQLALSNAQVRHRMLVGKAIAACLVENPHEWSWVVGAVKRLDPDPIAHAADDADDLPWLDAKPQKMSYHASAMPSFSGAPVLQAKPMSDPAVADPDRRSASTRPSLYAWRDRKKQTPP